MTLHTIMFTAQLHIFLNYAVLREANVMSFLETNIFKDIQSEANNKLCWI